MQEPQIYCPHCRWRPRPDSRWQCSPQQQGCGTVWNTFWTGGICPGCNHRWQMTQCLACHQQSPHPHWYHFPDDDVLQTEHEEQVAEHLD